MSTVSFTCGDIFPSGCVLFTGTIPTFVDSESIDCDIMLDDFLEKVTDKIEDILADTDLTQLDEKCFTFNPETVTIKELHQEEIDKICENETRLTELEESLLNLNIGTKTMEVDLGCLAPLAAPCEQDTNIYTLLSILLTLKSEICSLKAQLEECTGNGCGGGGNCTSGTSGVGGSNGTSGSSGASGTSGTSGSGAGTSGTSGGVGTSGSSGTSGECQPI
jgi:hypothetical protein